MNVARISQGMSNVKVRRCHERQDCIEFHLPAGYLEVVE